MVFCDQKKLKKSKEDQKKMPSYFNRHSTASHRPWCTLVVAHGYPNPTQGVSSYSASSGPEGTLPGTGGKSVEKPLCARKLHYPHGKTCPKQRFSSHSQDSAVALPAAIAAGTETVITQRSPTSSGKSAALRAKVTPACT